MDEIRDQILGQLTKIRDKHKSGPSSLRNSPQYNAYVQDITNWYRSNIKAITTGGIFTANNRGVLESFINSLQYQSNVGHLTMKVNETIRIILNS